MIEFFSFFIAIAASNKLDMQLMDVVTAYLHGLLEKDIYMKIPEGYKITDNTKQQFFYSIKLQRSLYGLKQSGRMWYNRFSDYIIKEGYQNDNICPSVFIKSFTN